MLSDIHIVGAVYFVSCVHVFVCATLDSTNINSKIMRFILTFLRKHVKHWLNHIWFHLRSLWLGTFHIFLLYYSFIWALTTTSVCLHCHQRQNKVNSLLIRMFRSKISSATVETYIHSPHSYPYNIDVLLCAKNSGNHSLELRLWSPILFHQLVGSVVYDIYAEFHANISIG